MPWKRIACFDIWSMKGAQFLKWATSPECAWETVAVGGLWMCLPVRWQLPSLQTLEWYFQSSQSLHNHISFVTETYQLKINPTQILHLGDWSLSQAENGVQLIVYGDQHGGDNQVQVFVCVICEYVQGVPKECTFELPFSETGFEGTWPSTASWLL